MDHPTTINRTAKTQSQEAEIAKLTKRCNYLDKKWELMRQEYVAANNRIQAIKANQHADTLREHIGSKVKFRYASDSKMLGWLVTLISIGRTRAVIQFDADAGNYSGKQWYWEIHDLAPVYAAEAGK